MAINGNLGAVNLNLASKQESIEQQLTIKGKRASSQQVKQSVAQKASKSVSQEEALRLRESSLKREKAIERLSEQMKPMSLEELAEMLRKVNLTFDLFEIQTRYTVNLNTGEVSVQIVNQRTGEVIRKIPPYEVPQMAEALKNGDPMVTDIRI